MIIKRLATMTDEQVIVDAKRRIVDYRSTQKRADFDYVMDLLERMTFDRSHLMYDLQGVA